MWSSPDCAINFVIQIVLYCMSFFISECLLIGCKMLDAVRFPPIVYRIPSPSTTLNTVDLLHTTNLTTEKCGDSSEL